ncbi:MAG: hypothetical protein Tsb002_17110 [Wenzhouxiangellaceae bacterium]
MNAQSLDQLLYHSDSLLIGEFSCRRDHPRFRNSGPARGDLVVFPYQAVLIHQDGHQPVVANPQVVTLYNTWQEYQRHPISDAGDHSIWLYFPRDCLTEALIETGRDHQQMQQQPFRTAYANCPSTTFLRQRRLLEYLRRDQPHDPLLIHCEAMQILAEVLQQPQLQQGRGRHPGSRPTTRPHHRQLVRDSCAYLSRHYAKPCPLPQLASAVGSSPFHLNRLFRRHTGISLHQYQLQLRLRHALDRIDQGDSRLTDLALDLGFSSPSHFSRCFRQQFHCPPSAWQQQRQPAPAFLSAPA